MTDPEVSPEGRVIGWFSCGAPSAVAVKLALGDYPGRVEIVRIDTGSEHPDNARYIADCEEWYGQEIIQLRSEDYVDTWDVWVRERWLNGIEGARCTTELKKRVREAYERPDDLHVWGYAAAPKREVDRANRMVEQTPGMAHAFPLIERGISKPEALGIIEMAGIELPAMYRLGYRNNNCIGCPKAGMGEWNMIRRDFPETFWRMARLERDIGHAILREGPEKADREPIWLDELDPERGDIRTDPEVSCSLNCMTVEQEMAS